MSLFKVTVVFQGENIEVSGNTWKACRGAREHGTGLQLEPDEPAGFEIETVEFKGVDVTGIVDLEKIEELVEKELSK